MSNSRGGFFSLNRFLGRKQKNGKNSTKQLSKSSAQTLTRSTSNIEDISPQNKITPLAAVPNAPFEQTFRTIVYLPHGQLYVARIGAKTKLYELLEMICANKLLDANKFQFLHPTDDAQVFSLDFTIGEVGLSEIKLAPKYETAVRYRIHSSSQETRPAVRPHTMSSVSPYSSTNSLNSADSLSITMSQRLSNSHIPAVPGRKKRIAPRPPSQNSIPEKPKQKSTGADIPSASESDKTQLKQFNLVRQNFHVSSPNLTTNNNATLKLHSSFLSTNTDPSNVSSSDDRPVDNGYQLSISDHLCPPQIKNNKTAEAESKAKLSITSNSQNHSRTSSETSDFTADVNYPEPQPRKRPIIVKQKAKKAPAPPPRTVSVMLNEPIPTPRCADQNLIDEGNCIPILAQKFSPNISSTMERVNSAKNLTNVSKVMLNVNESEHQIAEKNFSECEDHTEQPESKQDNNSEKMIGCGSKKMHETYPLMEKTPNESNPKKISVVDFNIEYNEPIEIEIDQSDISEQINEIIDEAAKINEAKLNTKNECRSDGKNAISEQTKEINNNNESIYDSDAYSKRISENNKTHIIAEVPIQPILNETRAFDYHDYSDHSLPISTSSTSNTMETPSTESIITSDIEDGYKGNEVEKIRKIEMNDEDSKEDFIESQFGFLSEHLDSKSDDEKAVSSIKRCNIISSTMIADKLNETYLISPPQKKKNVINELSQIIKCNRLETFIKPINETNNSYVLDKRSSLTNFQIGLYSNVDHENSLKTHISNLNDNINQQINQSTHESKCDKPIESKTSFSELNVLPKQIARSVSFHSTLTNMIDRQGNTGIEVTETSLSETPRSTSYISLNNIHKSEKLRKLNREVTITNLNETTRRKSSSELTIADSPSLQSIEVMKSILNNSRTTNIQFKSTINEKSIASEIYKEKYDDQKILERNDKKLRNSDASVLQSGNKLKTWKYQGPPSVSVSTWVERPMSNVCIKSDDDYIFGGTSKMAALQKKFSAMNGEINDNGNDVSKTKAKESTERCDNGLCKLPIVRSVEYKKNVVLNTNNEDSTLKDTPDSNHKSSSRRSSYELSYIVPEKPSIPEKNVELQKTMTLNRIPNKNQSTKISPEKLFSGANSNQSILYRVQSFNGQQNNLHNANITNRPQKNIKMLEEQFKTKQPEKVAIFSQFTLRRTGLKEKIFNEKNPKNTNKELKANIIPTAPKPPPMPKKSNTRPVSMGDIKTDPRDELLNSIRSFNRDTLKRNCIY